MNTISNTLVESYEERLANLQKEFGDVKVTDLDAKHKSSDSMEDVPHAEYVNIPGVRIMSSPNFIDGVRKEDVETRYPLSSPGNSNCIPRAENPRPGSPITAVNTPVMTPKGQDSAPPVLYSQERTARHSR
ncbi:hypothetical protein N0V95_005753, partial [Ascochyta clinopodiicola]